MKRMSMAVAFILLAVLGMRERAEAVAETSGTESLWPGAFRLVDSHDLPGGSWETTADASSGSEKCRFHIRIVLEPRGFFSSFKSPTVTFSSAPGSQCRGYLATLAGVLKFSGPLPTPVKRKEVSAVIVLFGDKLVRLPSGHGFGPKQTGTWLASKLTFESTGSEVYMNLDEANGIGDFSMKDEGYAADVMQELSPVLAGIY
jgi:hypothetical protein